jgi:hypothetical protein
MQLIIVLTTYALFFFVLVPLMGRVFVKTFMFLANLLTSVVNDYHEQWARQTERAHLEILTEGFRKARKGFNHTEAPKERRC